MSIVRNDRIWVHNVPPNPWQFPESFLFLLNWPIFTIMWLSTLSTLSEPDEGYFRNTNFDIYFFQPFDFERTWWRLFQKH
jgi:hypothetical protein